MTATVNTAPQRGPLAEKVLAAGNRVGIKLIPHLPGGLKRLLSGGRAINIDGNTLDPSVQMMLAAQRATGQRPQRRRRRGRHPPATAGDGPHGGRAGRARGRDTQPVHPRSGRTDPGAALPARRRRARPLLVFYHGGGWVIGDLDTHDHLCRLICRDAAAHVLSVDYRLAPEHKAPAAVDDAYAAYLWAREHAVELGADPGRVAVGGDSAGGNLAALVTLRARDAGAPSPALQWLIYPATDMRGLARSRTLFGDGFLLTKHDMDWFQDSYLEGSGVDDADPRVSPLLAGDLSGLSPALVVTAGFDPLRDEGDQYAAKLRAAGVTVDHRRMGSVIHGFAQLNALGGEVARANAEMISAFRPTWPAPDGRRKPRRYAGGARSA